MINTPNEFISYFLKSRNLEMPDGRPIYAYKVSPTNYSVLQHVLVTNWTYNRLSYACFILYAVEYLKSEFDEGALNWKEIFASLGKDRLNTADSRAEIIGKGLEFWRRTLYRSSHSTEYIETLRLETGIPGFCLSPEKNVSVLIRNCFQLLESFQISKEEIQEQLKIESEKLHIPIVLRQQTFLDLVIEFVQTLYAFKKNYSLGNQSNPVESLQSHLPNWRDELPIRIDNVGKTREFVDNLLRDVSKLKKLERPLNLIQHSLQETDNFYSIITSFCIPKDIYSYNNLLIEENDFNKLPSYINVFAVRDGMPEKIGSVLKTFDDKLSCVPSIIKNWNDEIYHSDLSLVFANQSGDRECSISLNRYSQLPVNIPLVFVTTDDKLIFKNSGSVKVTENVAILLIPRGFRMLVCDHYLVLGEAKGGYKVIEISSTCTLVEEGVGQRFRIQVSQQDDTDHAIDYRSKTIPGWSCLILDSHNQIYFGPPSVHLYNKKLGLLSKFKGQVDFKTIHGHWRPLEQMNEYGVVRTRCTDIDGFVKDSRSIAVLPEHLTVSIESANKSIHFKNVGSLAVRIKNNFLSVSIETQGDDKIFTFDAVEIKNDRVDFEVGSLGNPFIKISLPNPSLIDVFVNKNNELINRQQLVYSELYGAALVCFNLVDQTVARRVEMELRSNYDTGDFIRSNHKTSIPPLTSYRLPLVKLKPEIDRLFSIANSIDAYVRISTPVTKLQLDIVQYARKLKIEERVLTLDCTSDGNSAELNAIRLDKPFNHNEIVKLEYMDNTSSLNLSNSLFDAGVWLIYPVDEKLGIRPSIFLGQTYGRSNLDITLTNLSESSLLNFENRIKKLIEFFTQMSTYFEDNSWQELHGFYSVMGHLPINTLDYFKALVQSQKGMISFLLNLNTFPELVMRLTFEFNFNWHLVSIRLWVEIYQSYFSNLQGKYPDNIVASIIESKLNFISSSIGLFSVAEILRSEFHNQLPETIPSSALTYLIYKEINGVDGSAGVRNRNRDNWERNAEEFIERKFRALPEEVRRFVPQGIANFQRPVVFLPFIFAYHSVFDGFIIQTEINTSLKFALTKNIEFDKTYFENIFNLMQSWFYIKKN